MRHLFFLGVFLLAAAVAAAGSEPLLPAFRSTSDPATRKALVEKNKNAFLAEVVEALIQLEPGASSPLLEEAAQTYLQVTGDSLLVADLLFATTAIPGRREAWIRGVDLTARGDSLFAGRAYREAAPVYEDAVRAFQEAGHARREAVTWGTAGNAWHSAQEPDSAVACYRTALARRRELGDPLLIARALNSLGQFAMEDEEFDSALVYLDEARRLREDLGIPEELARTEAALGNLHYRLGNLEAARASYGHALDVLGPGSTSPTVGSARNGLGNVLHELGENREAADLYRSLIETAPDSRQEAVYRENLAAELVELGDPVEALRELHLARELEEEDGNTSALAATLNRTGEALHLIGNGEGALAAWRGAVAAADSSENAVVAREARQNLARGLGEIGLYDQAREIYRELLEAAEGDSLARAGVLADMGVLDADHGFHESALAFHREALLRHEAGSDVRMATRDRANVGTELTALGRLEEGRVELERARAAAESLDYRGLLGSIYLDIADNADQSGDLRSARDYNDKAIEIMESFRGEALSEDARASSLGRAAEAYEAQVNVLARLAGETGEASYRDDAFTMAERGKAQALLGVLSEARLRLSPHLPLEMETRKAVLERHIRETRYRLRTAEEAGSPPDSARALRARLDELEQSRNDIIQWGRLQDPRFAAVDPGEPAGPGDVKEHLLPADAALLEFALGDTVSYAWVVTPDSLALYRLPPRDRIAALVQALRGALDRDAGRQTEFVPAAARLGDAILAPVMPSLWRSRRIFIVPDGPLHFVPFELLLTDVQKEGEDPGAWPYALRNAVVSYGPSATSLLNLAEWRAERGETAEGFLGVGDPDFQGAGEPLPFTRTEVERIGSLFGERDRVLLVGNLAKEKTLTEPGFLSRFRFIHLATHGMADELRPERSRLALSSPEDASEDGYLQASEVYDLQLQADLVVLSACETGRGKMVQGEGVMGLPRAFLYAGAPAVVVSLWSVSDEATADLMAAFYEGMIRDGLAPAEALARAKERLRSGGRWAHPFYWAPFVLVGAG